MAIDPNIYWQYYAAAPKAKGTGISLASLMDSFQNAQQRSRQNAQQDELMQMKRQQMQMQQDKLKSAQQQQQNQNTARSIMQSQGVMRDPSTQGRLQEAAMYDPQYATSLAQLDQMMNPKPKQQVVGNQVVTLGEKPSAQQIQGFQQQPVTTNYDKWLQDTGNVKGPDSYKMYRQELIEGKKAGAAQTNINMGKIPAGYQMNPDNSMSPIPGSPAAREISAQAAKAEQNQAMADVKAETVVSKVDEALGQLGFTSTGFVGNMLGGIAGTDAYDLNKTVDTIKAVLAFDTLQKMREASPTGGALGQVSERELGLLESAVASLDVGQSEDQIKQNLEAIKRHYNGWKNTLGETSQPAPIDGAKQAPDGNWYVEQNGQYYRVEK